MSEVTLNNNSNVAVRMNTTTTTDNSGWQSVVKEKIDTINAAFPGHNQTADKLSEKYQTDTKELKNQLEALRSKNTGDWVPAAQKLYDSVSSLENLGLKEAVGKTYDDNVTPMYQAISDAGEDPVKTLARTDVPKVTDDLKSAATLGTSTQEYMATVSELTGALGDMWKDRSRGLQSDASAKELSAKLSEVLTSKGQQVVLDNQAAFNMHSLKDDANGRTDASPTWQNIRDQYATFSQNVSETFRADSINGEVNARDEIMTLMGKQDAALEDLIGTQKANQAMLDAQNLPIPAAEDNLLSYSDKLNQFLGDLKGDFDKAGGWRSRVESQTAEYKNISGQLKEAMKKWGWTSDDVKREDPALFQKLESRADDLAESSVNLLDAQKNYSDRVAEKATKWLEGWETTKKKEAQKSWVDNMNLIFDISTSMGIGGNAITQLATKQLKAATAVNATFADMTSAFGLRGGQTLDMVQSFINSGRGMVYLHGRSVDEVLAEFDESDAKTGTALSQLIGKLQDYYDSWDSKYFDPGEGSNW